MSLLLNALKKAEEGDKPEQTEGEEAIHASAPVDIPVDFDAITEESDDTLPGGDGGGDTPQPRARVDAARVFGASEDTSSGGGKKLVVGLLGVVLVFGGGYGVFVSGVIPGFDTLSLGGIFGGRGEIPAVSSSTTGGNSLVAELSTKDVVLLPIPVVDIQSEVDFSDLSLPENSPDVIGEDEYKRKIATYTGYDIDKELRKLYEDSGLIATEEEDSSIVDGFEEESAGLLENLAEEEKQPIRTAGVSREQKLRLEASTPSDSELDVVINSIGRSDSVESPQMVENKQPAVVAQIALSADGAERNAMLEQAKRLYYAGSYTKAETIYREVLRSAPTNRDSLRGIAQVAVATRRYRLAASTYLEMLSYYPDDPVAIAELINFRGSDRGDFYETEKILKGLIGKTPAVDGRVYFALGNLYAGAQKWYDAQKAYFDAYSRETDNPDYAYNLAVVLDYLNKPRLALGYYQQSLELSNEVLVGFNRADVEIRIKELSQ